MRIAGGAQTAAGAAGRAVQRQAALDVGTGGRRPDRRRA